MHEIKARTGAGNGYKHNTEAAAELGNYDNFTHKSHKIEQVIQESNEDLNLHEIKAKTGAGSGHKHTPSECTNTYINTNKIDKIYDVVTRIEGKANLHHIKAKTGAGNGYKHPNTQTDTANGYKYNTTQTSNENIHQATHKSHIIHAIFHNNDRKLNLHEIKARTGAGSGYKHHQ